ncbi:AEC family transporter [Siminovitchia sp. 179-K 8D1 HS]|uniref:AEC family transporter n=1 Tax=Siminovitchia sp. 179-K 8D1 HS TaxID=3142385 RepID=UPI0039A0CFAB
MNILLDVILPVFGIMLCGYLAGKFGIVSISGSKSLNNYVFYVALPALLFLSTATAPVEQLANWGFVGINLGGIFISYILAVFIGKVIFKQDLPSSSIYGMNVSYGTTGYMGIPLVIAAFGEKAALPAALATLIHNIPVITIVLLAIEFSKMAANREGKNASKMLWGIFKPVIMSPLTISVTAGIMSAALNIKLPDFVKTFSKLLADASGPTALFALGLALVGQIHLIKQSKINKSEIATIVILKLFFQPVITCLLMIYVFQIDQLWGIVSVLMSALPVGAGVYVFAQKYEKLVKQTSIAILISMFLSVVTVSGLLIFFGRQISLK